MILGHLILAMLNQSETAFSDLKLVLELGKSQFYWEVRI